MARLISPRREAEDIYSGIRRKKALGLSVTPSEERRYWEAFWSAKARSEEAKEEKRYAADIEKGRTEVLREGFKGQERIAERARKGKAMASLAQLPFVGVSTYKVGKEAGLWGKEAVTQEPRIEPPDVSGLAPELEIPSKKLIEPIEPVTEPLLAREGFPDVITPDVTEEILDPFAPEIATPDVSGAIPGAEIGMNIAASLATGQIKDEATRKTAQAASKAAMTAVFASNPYGWGAFAVSTALDIFGVDLFG